MHGWVRNPQTLKGVGECETLNPKRSEWLPNPHTKKEWVCAKPQTLKLKGVGGCETQTLKGVGVRNPEP